MNLLPTLTRNQWLWLGGAVALGVTEVVSAPIAVVLAALPVLDHYADEQNGSRPSRSSSSTGTTTARRRRRTGGTRGGVRTQSTATTS